MYINTLFLQAGSFYLLQNFNMMIIIIIIIINVKHLAQSATASWFRDGPTDPIRGYADVIKIKHVITN